MNAGSRCDTDKSEFTPQLIDKQAALYKTLFEVFRKHCDKNTGFTFRNLTDNYSCWIIFPFRSGKIIRSCSIRPVSPGKHFRAW